jgi:N-acetylglucosaminyldiphosphoundecaprenol N-acetyl-beta-D-mannosaminyltransferase
MGKQEKWIAENIKELEKAGVRMAMGVGRTFDYYSGRLLRAPKWARRMGLEWLFSLIVEPKRWRRQLALPKFVWKVLTRTYLEA